MNRSTTVRPNRTNPTVRREDFDPASIHIAGYDLIHPPTVVWSSSLPDDDTCLRHSLLSLVLVEDRIEEFIVVVVADCCWLFGFDIDFIG